MANSTKPPQSRKKRAPIPNTHTIHKRPPLRPAIPSPYSSRSYAKVVYVRAHTPFVSAVKRAQELLEQVAKRDQALIRGGLTDGAILARGRVRSSSSKTTAAGSRRAATTEDADPNRKPEEVFLKGTGRAIQRTLELGLYFQQRPQFRVRVTTGEVGVVDDIVPKEPAEVAERGTEDPPEERDDDEGDDDDVQMSDEDATKDESTDAAPQPVPETRIRKVSMVQVAVSWR